MITKKTKSNFFLIVVLLLAVIFYGYYISQNKGAIKVNDENPQIKINNNNFQKGVTKFTDVEYKTLNEKGREFITKGKEAFLDKDQPDLIKLNNVHSYTELNDGSILNIKSDKAQYYKNTKDIKYSQNVKIMNKDGIIIAENASFFANKSLIRLEKNVVFKDPKNTVKGDIAELNTITNNLEIFMSKKKDKVHGQRKQN